MFHCMTNEMSLDELTLSCQSISAGGFAPSEGSITKSNLKSFRLRFLFLLKFHNNYWTDSSEILYSQGPQELNCKSSRSLFSYCISIHHQVKKDISILHTYLYLIISVSGHLNYVFSDFLLHKCGP